MQFDIATTPNSNTIIKYSSRSAENSSFNKYLLYAIYTNYNKKSEHEKKSAATTTRTPKYTYFLK